MVPEAEVTFRLADRSRLEQEFWVSAGPIARCRQPIIGEVWAVRLRRRAEREHAQADRVVVRSTTRVLLATLSASS